MSLCLRINKNFVIASIFSLLAILFSLVFLPYYVNGDQEHYVDLYYGLSDRNFISAFAFYKARIGSAEPGYFLAAWVFSQIGLSKLFFVSFLNGSFAFFVVMFFRRINASFIILFVVLFFNYYSYVLFLSAERLKFALLIFVVALYYRDSKVGKIFLVFSWLSHVQIIMLSIAIYSPTLLFKIKKVFHRMAVSKKDAILLFMLFISMSLILVLLSEHIKNKMVYFELRGVQELIKAFSFMILALVVSSRRVPIMVIFLVLFVFIILLGEARINIFAFYVFFYFSMAKRSGLNLILALPLIYFSLTGILFLERIIQFGTGYLN